MAVRRLLIIDDDDGIREVAKMSLELVAGWEVVTAPSGEDGVRQAREERPEGILLDVMMPGMDGPATLQALRDDDLVGTIPVIFLTAKVQAAERTRFAEMDVAGLIAKPFDPMKLASQISDLLGLVTVTQPTIGDPSALRAALAALWPQHRDEVAALVGDIRSFVAAVATTDRGATEAETANRAAHRLAGSLGTFGIPHASATARSLEELIEAWRAGGPLDVADARQLVGRLAAEVAEFDAITRPGPSGGAGGSGRVVALVGLDATLAAQVAEEAAARRIVTERHEGLGGLLGNGAARVDAVVVDIDRVHVDVLEGAGWPTTGAPFVALSVGRRLADRVAAARLGARRYVLLPATSDAVVGTVESLWEQGRRTPTVVAVDDDPVILDTLRVLLADDVRLIAVDDQEQFWRALQEHVPDVVILDVDMPDITGIELCRVMRTDDRWQQTGIIFLTAHRDASTMHMVFGAGADDMVVKPIIGPELRARVNSRIERTELHRRLAETDGLTGLANRATAERVLERTAASAAARGEPMSVALIDLDHFKRVNDVHGHRSGDDVLRRFAEIIALGEPTLAGRWGGEEFIAAFDGVAARDAVERVSLVLDAFRRRSFVDADGKSFTCSFSAGIAEHPTDGVELGDLVRAADGALYEAKAGGRAQVVSLEMLRVPASSAPRAVDVVTVLDADASADIVAALAADGWTVAALGDGHEAIRRLVGPLADLAGRVVLLDDDAAGLDALSVLHHLNVGGVAAAVIVATGSVEAVAEATRLGAAAAVIKPVARDEVRRLVHAALQAPPR